MIEKSGANRSCRSRQPKAESRDTIQPVDALGYTAAVFATGSFVPQVIKTWRTRSAEDLSYLMLVTHIIGMLLWLVYGLMINATPIVAANTIAVLLDVALLALKMRAPDGAPEREQAP